MSHFPVSGVQARQSRGRTLLPVLGIGAAAVLIIGVASSGLLPRGGVPPAVPGAVVAPASPTASTADSNATPEGVRDAVRGGYSVLDVAGTWKGDVLVPWTGPNWESDPSKDTTWRLDMVIDLCREGESCGLWSFTTDSLGGTGQAASCDGTLTYSGFYEDRAAFKFAETITASTGPQGCQAATLVLTPLASGTRAGIEETSGGSWLTWGLVTRSVTP